MTTTYKYAPDYCPPPGATLREWMEDMRPVLAKSRYFHGQISKQLLWSSHGLDLFLDGSHRMPIDDVVAERLERVTGISKSFWLSREKTYREGLAKGLKVVR